MFKDVKKALWVSDGISAKRVLHLQNSLFKREFIFQFLYSEAERKPIVSEGELKFNFTEERDTDIFTHT